MLHGRAAKIALHDALDAFWMLGLASPCWVDGWTGGRAASLERLSPLQAFPVPCLQCYVCILLALQAGHPMSACGHSCCYSRAGPFFDE